MPKCCAPPAEGDQLVLQDCFPHVLRMVTHQLPLAGDPGLASLASKLSQLVTWKNTVDDHWIWGIHGESMGNMVIHHIPHYMIIKYI